MKSGRVPFDLQRQARRLRPYYFVAWENSSTHDQKDIIMAVRTHNQQNAPTKNDQGKNGQEPSVSREMLIHGLNNDLAGEYQAIVMYTTFSANLSGPYRKELRAFFQEEIADELRHAQLLADKIAALGGQPNTDPRPVPNALGPKVMLESALAAEKQAIHDYNERIKQAEAFGDTGLKVDLENQIADETHHKEELERILSGWEKC